MTHKHFPSNLIAFCFNPHFCCEVNDLLLHCHPSLGAVKDSAVQAARHAPAASWASALHNKKR